MGGSSTTVSISRGWMPAMNVPDTATIVSQSVEHGRGAEGIPGLTEAATSKVGEDLSILPQPSIRQLFAKCCKNVVLDNMYFFMKCIV
jgi:hypothetical protein